MTPEQVRILQSFQAFSPGNTDQIRLFFAPGRVNLIGEHTDYNGGYVLPAALELGTYAIVRPRADGQYRFASTAFPGEVYHCDGDVAQTAAADHSFASYPQGVIWSLRQAGVSLTQGADLLFHGNLPSGAGLSSSASLEVVTAFVIDQLQGSGLTRQRLAEISQTAERAFVGVDCGIMDQFAVSLGQSGHALLVDCATLAYQTIPFDLTGCQMVITHSNVPRTLLNSAYNERRQQCNEALGLIRLQDATISNLSDISVQDWPRIESYLQNGLLKRRARHVVFENERTLQAVQCLLDKDLRRFGQLMNQSHISLRDDFEVSGHELDLLVEAAWSVEGCIGSRMTGAGFGGCTVSLVAQANLEAFQREVARKYSEQTGIVPSFYVSAVGDGVRELKAESMRLSQGCAF